ncbi:hypothetical protein CAPTEDRAFT_192676 [Capitella teleta]|uniref:Sodium/calcium exchanger membrane region domain-containing protein n=1 Tax=Capitella teleta TaxID=283909 RepID=R7TYD7_CAPTE|nr:hypothetical protein CAPTEDRAFT_192676 [Capitella teleta]|eukprot:ELT96436.1 hypothetical protein CAPTEDRAFT_192676 [Capitella teleta]
MHDEKCPCLVDRNTINFTLQGGGVVGQFTGMKNVVKGREQRQSNDSDRTESCGGREAEIRWKTEDNAAKNGIDCIGSITFEHGETSKMLEIKIIDDARRPKNHLLVGLKDSVTALAFVALGTSLPDLLVSKQTVTMETTTDNSIGNVAGSISCECLPGPWSAVDGAGQRVCGGGSVVQHGRALIALFNGSHDEQIGLHEDLWWR